MTVGSGQFGGAFRRRWGLAGRLGAFCSALNALLKGRFEERCHVADEASKGLPDLVPVIESINREETKPHTIGCEWPEWIAARLWDRAAKDPADMNAALRLWGGSLACAGIPLVDPGNRSHGPNPSFLPFGKL